ncbi:unnamed protein product [Prunus armeniaca]
MIHSQHENIDPTVTNSNGHELSIVLAGTQGENPSQGCQNARYSLHPRPTPNPKYTLPHALLTEADTQHEPTCFSNANKQHHWRTAMNEELNALIKNGIWSLVPYDPSMNVVGCKWVFRVKRKADGTIDRYKARLVAKGFHQQKGVGYTETFSPVVKPTTIRTVLSLAVSNGWEARQLDVSNAFLHGHLKEEVYVIQAPGFLDSFQPHHVCKLYRSLYGLKQAPQAWFQCLSSSLLQLQFVGSKMDSSLFVFNDRTTMIYVLVYVDDIIITGNNSAAIGKVISTLSSTFALKDLGILHYFLGIEVVPHSGGLILSQRKYIIDLLKRSHLADIKPIDTPMASSSKLSKSDGEPLSNPQQYRSILGTLEYVTLTRPELSFFVNKVCQFMHNPTSEHWVSVKRILRYLKKTISHGLFLSHAIQAFCDADWAGCLNDCRSIGGFAIYLGCNLVSWSAKKQHTVARSSTEVEYHAIANTSTEIIWFSSLLQELGISTSTSPVLWCDNLGATYLSANPIFHARTKHVEINYHFVRDQVSARKLSVKFISTKDQRADIMTKPLSSPHFTFIIDKLRVQERST